MKGKIFAMFALVSVALLVFCANSASATTYTLGIWVGTDKEKYNPTEDVTITVSSSTALLITDLDTPINIEDLLHSDSNYWITCRVVDKNGNTMFRGGTQVIQIDSIMPFVWASFVWENPPAGEYTAYGMISTRLVSDSGDYCGVASGEATTTFTVVGPPADAPGFSHIPENQGTAHNPNL